LGIGARSLQECLILQARRKTFKTELPMKILTDGFDMFVKVQVSGLAKKFDCTSDDIQKALKEISDLDPKPGRQIGGKDAPIVTPDLYVYEVDGEWTVTLNDRSVPKLQISNTYLHLIQRGSKAPKADKQFIRDKLNTANWLIKSIEQRKSSMLKVMHAILEEQKEFFEKGPAFLKPLILQDIADKVGMHISTVNRVTNGKYVQIEEGLFELKRFFSASVKQEDGSEVSAVQTKDAIKKLIDNEKDSEPLSDQKIADMLKEDGLEVARRTVAKYREQMDILPARLRKKY
jgi:RNA polymerase sigma-54 factor